MKAKYLTMNAKCLTIQGIRELVALYASLFLKKTFEVNAGLKNDRLNPNGGNIVYFEHARSSPHFTKSQ